MAPISRMSGTSGRHSSHYAHGRTKFSSEGIPRNSKCAPMLRLIADQTEDFSPNNKKNHLTTGSCKSPHKNNAAPRGDKGAGFVHAHTRLGSHGGCEQNRLVELAQRATAIRNKRTYTMDGEGFFEGDYQADWEAFLDGEGHDLMEENFLDPNLDDDDRASRDSVSVTSEFGGDHLEEQKSFSVTNLEKEKLQTSSEKVDDIYLVASEELSSEKRAESEEAEKTVDSKYDSTLKMYGHVKKPVKHYNSPKMHPTVSLSSGADHSTMYCSSDEASPIAPLPLHGESDFALENHSTLAFSDKDFPPLGF